MSTKSAVRANEARLTIVTNYPPLPATDGGRLDVWSLLRALHAQGVSLQLVANDDRPIDPTYSVELGAVCDSIVEAHPRRNPTYWARAAWLLHDRPLFAARRTPSIAEFQRIREEVASFAPDAVMGICLDNVPLVAALGQALGLVTMLRSQNIEHLYKRRQHDLSTGRQRLRSRFDLIGLERFEREALRSVDAFFDISLVDLDFWRNEGLTNGHWVPPIVFDTSDAECDGCDEPSFDVGFVGNLWTPNNIEAVNWLLRDVRPRIEARLGRAARILIAGSRPAATVVDLCAGDSGIELRADFADVMATMREAAVLVNPMLTGSGVALKTIDMLRSGRPVVSTPRGCTGLPDDIIALLQVAGTADRFADAISAALRSSAFNLGQQAIVSARFGLAATSPIVDVLRQHRGQHRGQGQAGSPCGLRI